MTARKSHAPTLLVFAVVMASSWASVLGAGCNGCNSTNQNYPVLDAGAEYPVSRGSAAVNTNVEVCPASPMSLAVTPATAVVGQSVSVTGVLAAQDASTTTLTWSTTNMVGTFASPHALATTFVCSAAGPTKLILSVTQGDCTAQRELAYFCYGSSDDAGVAAGGAGGVRAGTGGMIGNTGGGMATGGTPGSTGGSPGTTGGGPGTTGGAPGTTGGAPGATGGNGPPPMTGGSSGTKLTNTCPADEPAPKSMGPSCSGPKAPRDCERTCTDCLVDECSLGPSPATDGCCGLKSVSDQALCVTLLDCLVKHPAFIAPGGDATNSFCGTSGNGCFMTSGAANGPCTAEIYAAAKSMEPATVQGQFTSPASPVGRAVNLVACMGSFCPASCGIPGQE